MNPWSLEYTDFNPQLEAMRESLCTLGNGYFASRGAAEESVADKIHYPGTYLNGGYNRLTTCMNDQCIVNEDLVNFPNWLMISFRHPNNHWFTLNSETLLSYRQELDMKHGLLTRQLRYQDPQGRITKITSQRFVHMGHPHLAAICYRLTAENWSGKLYLKIGLDGSVTNNGIARYQKFDSKHLEVIEKKPLGQTGILLHVRTHQSHLEMAQAARLQIYQQDRQVQPSITILEEPEGIYQTFHLPLVQGDTISLEKVIALYTSRDQAISECVTAATEAICYAPKFNTLVASQAAAWQRLWQRCALPDIREPKPAKILRLAAFHLLQTVSWHAIDRDVSVPARGLHGEAYRGHIFWDEIFILPWLSKHFPEIARSALLYRYRRLDAARRLAFEAGYQGAMYPWQSGSDGREESQKIHLNPLSNAWYPDYSRYQRHINAAIVYNIWRYYTATQDLAFISLYGAEICLEIAKFWASLASYNKTKQRYEILHVMGPDEYHEKYPDHNVPGINNNAYTNIMAVWSINTAGTLLKLLPEIRQTELKEQLAISKNDWMLWQDITHKMWVPFFQDGQIICQFEGYEKLQEFAWDNYRQRYGNIERVDRILKAEGLTPDSYQITKQADVVMLFYLFSLSELQALFQGLGYELNETIVKQTISYYLCRTSHGSTLSKLVYARVLANYGLSGAEDLRQQALGADYEDSQGTTGEGIHLGSLVAGLDLYADIPV